ncbi:MAG: histidine kinase [Rikenellaceae bacterium]
MSIKILLLISIAVHTLATLFALRLVRETKYNIIWILFILGFTVLSFERYLQVIRLNGGEVSEATFIWTGFIASIGISIGIFYGHKLVMHIDRLNRQQELVSKRILAAALRAEEQSRSKISKELHDGLGPLLSAAKMSISALEVEVEAEEREKIIANTTHLVDEAIHSLREISNNLSPRLLNDFGLRRALQNFIGKCGAGKSIAFDFTSNIGRKRYDGDLEVVLYRVICELVQNTIKYASASMVIITIEESEGRLAATYYDDGKGFELSQVREKGQGLSNIASRISSLEGSIYISSTPEHGMRANISLPIIKS